MSEPGQKCENNAVFEQNYALKLFIAYEKHILAEFNLCNTFWPDSVIKVIVSDIFFIEVLWQNLFVLWQRHRHVSNPFVCCLA